MTTGSLEQFLEKNSGNNISDEDLKSSILPFFLKNIMTSRAGTKTLNKNIIKINSDRSLNFTKPQVQYELPAYVNLFSKRNENSLLCEESFFYDQEENMLLFNRTTPYVKLYKIFEKDDKYTEVHLPFEVVLKEEKTEFQEDLIQKILNGGGDGAVGIASFNWISDGRNDANKNQYSVNIKIIMQSINELEKIRNKDRDNNSVSILSLLYPVKEKNGKTTPDPENDTEIVDTSKQLIRAEIGYLLPQEYQEKYKNYFKTTLNLYLHKHNFSFHENGKVELDISYIANIENEFGNSVKWNLLENKDFKILKQDLAILKSLVFSNGTTIKTVQEIQKLGLTKETLAALTGGNQPANSNNKINQQYVTIFIKQKEGEIAKIKLSTFVELLNNLIKKKKLNSYVLDKNEAAYLKSILSISDFNEESLQNVKKLIGKLFRGVGNNKAFPKSDEALKIEDIEETDGGILGFGFLEKSKNLIDQKKLEEKLKNLEDDRGGDDVASRMDFIFLGDLLQEIIDITLPEKQKEKFNIFLSPFGYIDYTSIKNSSLQNENLFTKRKMPDGTQRKTLNIKGLKRHTHSMAYIPVSLPSLIRWWNREIIEKNETHYSLFKMLRTIVNRLVPESIGIRSAPNAPTQYFGTYNINYNTNDQVKKENNNIVDIRNLSNHFASRTNSMNKKDLYSNIVFVSSREDPNLPNVYKGNFFDDCAKNIFHAQINNSNSIIKKASFKRDDNAKLETANLLASADGAPNEIIRQVYHCNLEMIGNNFFEPGSLVYIRPSFPGTNLQNEVLHKIGLGGYYRIIKIDNKISPSGYNTTLQCRWEMWGPRGLKQ